MVLNHDMIKPCRDRTLPLWIRHWRENSEIEDPANASNEKVQVGKDQEKAQSEKDSHSKNRGGKKNQTNSQVLIP